MRAHLNTRNSLAVKRLNQNSLWASALLASAVLFAVLACTAQTPAKPDASTSSAAFLQLYRVLTSPRCQNCHPAGDAPLQGDDSQDRKSTRLNSSHLGIS